MRESNQQLLLSFDFPFSCLSNSISSSSRDNRNTFEFVLLQWQEHHRSGAYAHFLPLLVQGKAGLPILHFGVLPTPTLVTRTVSSSPLACSASSHLKAPGDSSFCTCSPAVCAGGGRLGKDACQLLTGLIRDGACAGLAEVGTHTNYSAML